MVEGAAKAAAVEQTCVPFPPAPPVPNPPNAEDIELVDNRFRGGTSCTLREVDEDIELVEE